VKIQLHPEASAELAAEQAFYEERMPGLGIELEEEIHDALGMIASMPEAWEQWPDLPEVRVFVLDRFPFLLPYWYEVERVVLLAVAHAKRRPGYWRDRLPEVRAPR
jgi:toxin ParE1/3/4